MKNTFKRVISVILAVAMLIGAMPAVLAQENSIITDYEQKLNELLASCSAEEKEKMFSLLGISTVEQFANEEPLTSGIFQYVINENNEAVIVGLVFENAVAEISIPDTIDGYPVTEIDEGALTTCISLVSKTEFPAITTLHLGKNVKNVGTFVNFDLKKITVDVENEYFYASDDILYSKATSQPILIPLGKEFDRFEIDFVINTPEDAEAFLNFIEPYGGPLYFGLNVNEFVFTENFTDSFWSYTMSNMGDRELSDDEWDLFHQEVAFSFGMLLSAVKAKKFVVPSSCEFLYTDEFGVLYSKDKSILIKYPIGNTDIDIYAVDENVDLSKSFIGYSGVDTLADSLCGTPFTASNHEYAITFAFYAVLGIIIAEQNAETGSYNLENIPEEALSRFIYQLNRLKNDLDKWLLESAPANLTVHVPNCVMETLPAELILLDEAAGKDRVSLHPFTGVNICVENDVTFSEYAAGTLASSVKVSDYNALVRAEAEDYQNDWDPDQLANNENISEESRLNYNLTAFELFEAATHLRPLSEFEFCEGNHAIEAPDTPDDPELPEIDETVMPTPSVTTIKYGDSIVLHVDPAKVPEGGHVEWTSSNNNFEAEVSRDGLTCTITPDRSGNTTFTATIYDADGNVVSADEQEMTSKAGFWQKLVAFFKGLFGLTKVIPQAFRY